MPIIFPFGDFSSNSNQLRFARSPYSKTMLKIDQDIMSLSVSHDVTVDDMLNLTTNRCEEGWSTFCWAKTMTFLVYRYFIDRSPIFGITPSIGAISAAVFLRTLMGSWSGPFAFSQFRSFIRFCTPTRKMYRSSIVGARGVCWCLAP